MPDEGNRNEANGNVAPSSNNDKGKFGYFCFTPSWLQWLNNPWSFLVGIAGLTIAQSLAVIGILATVMPQIEKRFNFSSFDAGMIAASNDVAAVVFGLFVSHYGNFGNKVKWIGFGGIVTGIGFLIFTLPHFIIGAYEPPPVSFPSLVCKPPATPAPTTNNTGNSSMTTSAGCNEGFIADWYYLALMLIGQFVAGMGTISLYSLTPTCFDECVTSKNIPLFLGLWQGSIFAGPMIAFGLSEPILELYVDINQPEGFNMTPLDPRWIGNWWVGFVGSAGLSFLSAFFLLGFPTKVRAQKGHRSRQPSVQDNPTSTKLTAREKLEQFPKVLKETLTNWTFVFNSLGTNCTLLYSEGLVPFIAKVLILRFGVEPQNVGNALTISAAPPLLIGVLVGAFLTRTFNLESSGRKSAFFCFITQLFTIIGPLAFLTPGCNEINLAGWQEPYGARIVNGNGFNFTEYPAIPGVELGSTCNQNCSCHLGIALPVCGSDNITYLSPCYAGCAGFVSQTKFANCSCISSDNGFGGTAEIGYCERGCKNWFLFLVLMSFVSLAFFLQLTPSKVVLMRCLRPDEFSFAFGLQYLSTKVIAHIPGPILFGHVVDLNCVIWQRVCDKTGFCWIYDMDEQMKMITTIAGTLAGLGMLFFFLSWLFYKEAERPTSKEKNALDNLGMDKISEETKM